MSESSGKIYTGQTNNLFERLKRHNSGLPNKKTSYTFKNTGPWNLVYIEGFKTRKEVLKREKQLKSAKGREFIREEIMGR